MDDASGETEVSALPEDAPEEPLRGAASLALASAGSEAALFPAEGGYREPHGAVQRRVFAERGGQRIPDVDRALKKRPAGSERCVLATADQLCVLRMQLDAHVQLLTQLNLIVARTTGLDSTYGKLRGLYEDLKSDRDEYAEHRRRARAPPPIRSVLPVELSRGRKFLLDIPGLRLAEQMQTSALESPSDEAAQKSFYAMLRAFGQYMDPALLPNVSRGSFSRLFKAANPDLAVRVNARVDRAFTRGEDALLAVALEQVGPCKKGWHMIQRNYFTHRGVREPLARYTSESVKSFRVKADVAKEEADSYLLHERRRRLENIPAHRKHRDKEYWTEAEISDLLMSVRRNGENWDLVQREVPTKSVYALENRYLKVKNLLRKNPRATLRDCALGVESVNPHTAGCVTGRQRRSARGEPEEAPLSELEAAFFSEPVEDRGDGSIDEVLDVTGRWSIEDGPLGRTDVLTYDYLEDGLTYQESILEYDYPGADLPDRDDTDGRERFLDGREAIDGASDETEEDPYASKSFQEVPLEERGAKRPRAA